MKNVIFFILLLPVLISTQSFAQNKYKADTDKVSVANKTVSKKDIKKNSKLVANDKSIEITSFDVEWDVGELHFLITVDSNEFDSEFKQGLNMVDKGTKFTFSDIVGTDKNGEEVEIEGFYVIVGE